MDKQGTETAAQRRWRELNEVWDRKHQAEAEHARRLKEVRQLIRDQELKEHERPRKKSSLDKFVEHGLFGCYYDD